ncbi:ATP-binding protein [soil metagenome]
MSTAQSDDLGHFSVLSGLSREDLEALRRSGREVEVAAGTVVLREGAPAEALYLVLEGRLEVRKGSADGESVVGAIGPGEVFGEMALLAGRPRFAGVRAVTRCRLLEVGRDAMERLLARPPALRALLRTTVERLQLIEAALKQREKLAALGELTAGLLHNLNNPAGALRRSTAQLQGLLDALPDPAALSGGTRPGEAPSDPVARAEREEDVEAWLDDRGVPRAWEFAPELVSQGWDTPQLDELARNLPDGQAALVAPWLSVGSTARQLTGQAGVAAARISEIVAAVLRYSRHDRAPVDEIDVHEGLDSTLVMLDADRRVTVTRDYDPRLPPIEAYPGQLHQVWTNLITNALEAMEENVGGKELLVRTRRQDDRVVVEVVDNGPGFSDEAAARLFEPFYTTKPPGRGTGLGLHTVWTAVVGQHGGVVEADGHPGRACFRVVLPRRLPATRPGPTEAGTGRR